MGVFGTLGVGLSALSVTLAPAPTYVIAPRQSMDGDGGPCRDCHPSGFSPFRVVRTLPVFSDEALCRPPCPNPRRLHFSPGPAPRQMVPGVCRRSCIALCPIWSILAGWALSQAQSHSAQPQRCGHAHRKCMGLPVSFRSFRVSVEDAVAYVHRPLGSN